MTPHEVATPGGTFLVRQVGDGPPLLYLHDEIASGWGPLAARLAERHRVIAPVHPGFGASERPEWVESVRDVVEHYLALFESQPIGPDWDVVGASMGGWIAAEFVTRLFGRVRSLVLVNPYGIHVSGHPPADFWYERNREEILFNDLEAMPLLELEEQVVNEEAAARYGWSPRLYEPTLAPRLHRVSCPVLIVWGADDRVLPRAHLDSWQERLPQAAVVEVPGAGHFPGYEAAERTATAIEEFLAEPLVPEGASRS